jgi:hypothetical protein
MAKVITTELQHSGASAANITLDNSKNVTCGNNLTVDGNLTVTGTNNVGAVTALNGATENELLTVGATTTQLDAEAKLTFDGTNLFIGGGSSRVVSGNSHKFVIEDTGAAPSTAMGVISNTNGSDGAAIRLGKTRATSLGGVTATSTNDNLGQLEWMGADGSNLRVAGRLRVKQGADTDTNSVPGYMQLMVTADGGTNPTERFRIAMNGDLTATDTSIGSLSDQRLKKNIADFTYDLSKFKAFKPRTFEWKNPAYHSTATGIRGFVAQELESTDNYWVTEQLLEEEHADDVALVDADRKAKIGKLGQKDAMYVSVIQQLITKIETLETKVAALEAG